MMSDRSPRPRLWLDRLDADVLTHIAAHLFADPNSSAALSLAETSPIQCRAVLASLSHTLRFTNSDADHASRWTQLARDTIQTLSFLDEKIIRFPRNFSGVPYPSNPLSLMQVPSLRRVEIFDDVHMLKALRGSPAVRQLLILVEGRAHTALIASIITSLRLSRLELHCNVMGHSCPLHELSAHHISSSTVRSLDTLCQSPHHDEVLMSFIPKFQNLQEVTVSNQSLSNFGIDFELYNCLEKMTSVRIKYAVQGLDLALRLGSRVTCLHLALHSPLAADQLLHLHACSAIQDFSVQVEHGAEDALRSLLGCLENLVALEFSVAKPRYFYRQKRSDIAPTPQDSEASLVSALSEKNVPRLRQLQLVDSAISVRGMTRILSSMGARLTHFTVPILHQKERPLERLALVLQALITHCPNLKSFSCREYPTFGTNDGSGGNVRDDTKRVQTLLHRLRMRVPSLRCEPIERAIESLHEYPYDEPFATPT